MGAVVELIGASKSYPSNGSVVHALRNATLAIEPGSFTALVGRSGCGKTTLLSLAGAVDLPTAGDVRIEGASTLQMNEAELSRLRRTRIGFIFQFFHLLPTLTVAENIALPLLLESRKDSSGQQARTEELMAALGLRDRARHFPHQLSGGEAQRVAIARALAINPAVIVADEPTGNLDSANAEIVLEWLRRIATERGNAVLMATHSHEAAAFASRVIEMRDGQLLTS